MTVSHRKFTAVVLAAMAIMSPVWGQSPGELEKIQNAIPAKPTVKPEKPRRVLVFSQALKYKHASIPYGEQAFKIMGEKTGAFTADLSSDPESLTADNIARYDAIIFNNTTGDFLTTETARQALLDYVKSGKGVVGIHAASDSNYAWPEYGKLIGGYFDNHPWKADSTVTLKVEQPEHPVAKAFKDSTSFVVKDEIYQFMDPYNRGTLLVLTSLDTDKTDMNVKGIKRTDGDFAVSWVQPYGEGRVFYCSLGHNKEIFWNPTVLQHYLDGIQFALGDLDAPAEPQARAAAAAYPGGGAGETDETTASSAALSEADVIKAFEGLRAYDYGRDRAFLLTLDEAIRQTADKKNQRNRIANVFAEAALDEQLSFAARELALKRLGDMGTGEQVGQIEKLLQSPDEKLAERVRQTIQSIPGERSDKAMVAALESTSGKLKVGVIHGLGKRKVGSAVKALTAIARGNNEDEARAAMQALGDIATEDAGKALLDDIRPPDATREAWLMASNDAASTLADKHSKLAERLYERVLQVGKESPARLAAFKGMAILKDQAEAMALKTLDQGDEELAQVARELLVRGKDESITEQLKQRLADADAAQKVTFVEILGARGDKAALQEITALAENAETEEVQIAALRALENLGNEKSVPLLVKVAAEAKGAVADAAEATLKEIPVPEVDPEVLRLVNEAPSEDERIVAMETAAARKSPNAMDAIIVAAGDKEENSKVAIAAFKAAADVLTYQDLGRLLQAHNAANGERVLREASRAVVTAAKEYKDKADGVKQVVAAIDSAPNDDAKASLLGVLGTLGTSQGLKTLQAHLDSDNEKIRDGAVRGIADFPSSSAMDDLLKIASESDSQVHKVLAVRGIARLLDEPAGKTAPERLDMAKRALELAQGPEEKKAIIGAMADMNIPGILPLILPFMDQPDFQKEAAAAIIKHAPVANAYNPGATAEALNPLSSKLEKDQWDKLEEALTPSTGNAGAIRAWQASDLYRLEDSTPVADLLTHEFAPESGGGEWTNALWADKDEAGEKLGQANLREYFSDPKNVVVYLRAHVWSPEERKARIDTGSDDGLRVWFNKERVFSHDKSRKFEWWGDQTPVTLKRGWNTILLKVGQGTGDWSVATRVVDASGKPMDDLKYSAMPPSE